MSAENNLFSEYQLPRPEFPPRFPEEETIREQFNYYNCGTALHPIPIIFPEDEPCYSYCYYSSDKELEFPPTEDLSDDSLNDRNVHSDSDSYSDSERDDYEGSIDHNHQFTNDDEEFGESEHESKQNDDLCLREENEKKYMEEIFRASSNMLKWANTYLVVNCMPWADLASEDSEDFRDWCGKLKEQYGFSSCSSDYAENYLEYRALV